MAVPESFRELIQRTRRPRFALSDVTQEAPGLALSSVQVYLSQLVSAGEIRRVGPALFEHETIDLPRTVEDPHLRPVINHVRSQLLPEAMHRIVAWSDNLLAAFSHDAIVDPFVVIEARRPVLETVQHALIENWACHPVKWRTRLGHMLWESPRSVRNRPDVFLVNNSSLDGTRPASGGFRTPSPERLFTDVVHFKPLFPATPLNMLAAPDFDPHEALRLAGRRGNTAFVASFLTWAALKQRGKLLDEVQTEFPHLALGLVQ